MYIRLTPQQKEHNLKPNKLNKSNTYLGALLLTVVLLLITTDANQFVLSVYGEFNEDEFYSELKECTTGLASGYATPDGRPLLWKNRDLGGGMEQEYHYVDDGRIPYISQVYSNRGGEYYGGINAAGFAVENSNSYNFDIDLGGRDDDGYIMFLALATCRTVDDFARILDSTNIAGRSLNCNYGTFDAFGGAVMFETGAYTYTAVDAVEAEDGFVVRSNYSASGNGLNNRANYWGPNRHDRAQAAWKSAVDNVEIEPMYTYIDAVHNNELTPQFIYRYVIRNLAPEGMTDYAVPYEGYVDGYQYGAIPNGESLCRSTTRAVMIAQGVRANENPDDAIMWIMAGNSVGSIVTPLWVRAGSVPTENDDLTGSRLCKRANEIRDWVYQGAGGVNTFKLSNADGTGFWDYALPLEEMVFSKVERFLSSPQFNYDRLEAFQNEMAQQIADSIEAWHPAISLSEIVEPQIEEGNIVLAWIEAERDPAGGAFIGAPNEYAIYRSDEPFREGNNGELIDLVAENRYVDEEPLNGKAFYRIEARF